MEYAIYPFEHMNITQRYDQGNHIAHWKNSVNYSDKPWDEACQDSGRSYFAPKNDFIIEEVLGIDTSNTKAYTNTVRLISANKLTMPCGRTDYLKMSLTHMNEDNLRQVQEGQLLKAGSKVLLEGTDGQATGNHFHVTTNVGNYFGCLKNSNNSWCYTYEKSLLPEEAFYLDSSYTKIVSSNGINFQNLPVEIPKKSPEVPKKEFGFLGERGYLKFGDSGNNVKKICDFFYNKFPAYDKVLKNKQGNYRKRVDLIGEYFGENLEAWVKEFQGRTELEPDGAIGQKTLAKMKEFEFTE